MAPKAEKRMAEDGKKYTQEQFKEFFGAKAGQKQWVGAGEGEAAPKAQAKAKAKAKVKAKAGSGAKWNFELQGTAECSIKSPIDQSSGVAATGYAVDFETPLTIVILGATGDLCRKKLYRALYQLMYECPEAKAGKPLLPVTANVIGVGIDDVKLEDHIAKQCVNVKGDKRDEFFKRVHYFKAGTSDDEYSAFNAYMSKLEGGGKANRIFFFSLPPTIFGSVVKCIKKNCPAPNGGKTKLIMEKPFGRDSRSFKELSEIMTSSFDEEDFYRIDHYLGKEVVLNLVTLRFGNQMFAPLWNKEYIQSVQIVFKENLGTDGRGGYFDKFGIMRDIMQNHLLQVMIWFGMEPPDTLDRAEVAKTKVAFLKSIKTLGMNDCFLGQFGKNEWQVDGKPHVEHGYLDDATVPPGSKCATYAAVVLKVNNDRWRGVPFLMRAGKGLDERMAEIRVTFKHRKFNSLVPGAANEMVMRIQPEEAVYFKMQNKEPGWEQRSAAPVLLDMSYKREFGNAYVADAYERVFLNAAKGDGSLFVGSGELKEAWRIFTPLLDEIDSTQPTPTIYPFGVRVPPGMDDFAKKYGIEMEHNWEEMLSLDPKFANLEQIFAQYDTDKTGKLKTSSFHDMLKNFFEFDSEIFKIMHMLDSDGDGFVTLPEFKEGVAMVRNKMHPNSEHGSFAPAH